MTDIAIKDIEVGTGVRLSYAERPGDEGAGTVLLLHGYSDSWYSYDRVLRELPAGPRALALTQRGHGDSDKPDAGYAMTDFAADAIAFLDAVGVQRAAVVGHSMGSFIAQAIAMDHADRVSHVALIGSAPTANIPALHEFAEAVQGLADPLDRAFVHEFQASTLHRPIPEDVLNTIVDESMKMPARAWRDALSGLIAFDAADQLGELSMPVAVFWGDQDGLFDRAAQDDLVARIPNAALHAYEDTGHGLHWERPERFTADLAAFIGLS